MKRNILNNLKPAALIVLAVIVFSGLQVFASTYSEPADQSENAAKPVTVSEDDQVMKSNFYSRSFLKAGNTVRMAAPSTTADPTWNRPNAYVAEKAVITPRFMVSGNFGLLSKKSQLRIGSPTVSADLPASQPFAGDAVTPVIIDMNGRGSGGDDPAGREAIELHSTYRAGYVSAKPHITVGTPAFQFSSTANVSNDNNNRKADVIAGKLAFSANTTSGTGVKVLVATDTNGNAVLGTMKIVTNTDGTKRIQVDYPGSPVATGQNSCGVVTQPPADLCPNISGTQTTVPAGMIVDGSGNCVTPPPVDLCTNITGTQTTVPAGMIKDTPGNTPGVCAVPPPVDLCTNITGTQTTVPVGYHLEPVGSTTCIHDQGRCAVGFHEATNFMNKAQVQSAGGIWEDCPTSDLNVRIMRVENTGGDSIYLNGWCQKATGSAGGTLCPVVRAGSTGTNFVSSCSFSDNFYYQLIKPCLPN